MKKLSLLTIAAGLIFSNASSQITKTNWMIGGAASFRSSNYEEAAGVTSKQIIVQLSGNVGYFLIDKLTVGLKPEYERTEVKQNANHQVVNTYGLGPFVRYYYLPVDRYVNIFSELSYQYGIIKTNQSSSTNNSNKLSGLAGCAVFFNSTAALEITVGYSSFSYNTSGNVKSLIAGLGFQFHLENEK